MRRLLFFIVITAMGMGQGLSQSLIQTYTDRCTGQVHVFSVPMNGSTVVAFYNKSKTFTYQDFQNGTLQAWLEETYLWWTNLSPCSSTTTGATATQQTTQQTTQQATQAAANATQNTTTNVSPPATSSPPTTSQTSTPPPADNSTTNTTGSTQDTTASGSATGSTGDNTSGSGTTETGSTESQSGSTESGSSSTETSESTGSTEGSSESSSETKTEESSETKTEEKTEEVKEEKKEEIKEESKDEKSDESKEEDSEEKSDEEKSDDEESEDKEEEDSEEKKDNEDEEEDDKDKKKKRNLAPPVVMANMLAQQMPTGEYSRAAMFGVSQTSLLGTETYGLNLMVYDNLQQFMLNGSYSKVYFTNTNVSELVHGNHSHYSTSNEVTTDDPTERPVPRVNRVYSASIGGMKMFTTYMAMMNHSMVWLGLKGSATGLAFGTSVTSLDLNVREGNVYYDDLLLSTSLTGFWTKPFTYSPKLTVAPMVAVSSPFMSISIFGKDKVTWNTDLMIIGGSNFNYSLTQRFGLSVGVTLVESTIKDFPTVKTYMIGGRLSF